MCYYLRDPIRLAVFTHYRSVTDTHTHTHTHTQTDRYTTTAYTALSIASRGKNCLQKLRTKMGFFFCPSSWIDPRSPWPLWLECPAIARPHKVKVSYKVSYLVILGVTRPKFTKFLHCVAGSFPMSVRAIRWRYFNHCGTPAQRM